MSTAPDPYKPLDWVVRDLVANDPARKEAVDLFLTARNAMRQDPDDRWRDVANLMDDYATRVADIEYRVDAGWIERNFRGQLAVARGYLNP